MNLEYVPVSQRPKTIISDVDGVILIQANKWPVKSYDPREVEAIPNTVKILNALYTAGHQIILVTARPEEYRQETSYQLKRFGLQFTQLVMGLPTGQRILINDMKLEEEGIPTAIAINLIRDEGLTEQDLEFAEVAIEKAAA